MEKNIDTAPDPAGAMKARLRADLRVAMKGRQATEAKSIRALIAAIDNAEAPSADIQPAPILHHDFHSGAAEVERLRLSAADLHRILATEVEERERAAAELQDLGQSDRAAGLHAEAAIARRYID